MVLDSQLHTVTIYPGLVFFPFNSSGFFFIFLMFSCFPEFNLVYAIRSHWSETQSCFVVAYFSVRITEWFLLLVWIFHYYYKQPVLSFKHLHSWIRALQLLSRSNIGSQSWDSLILVKHFKGRTFCISFQNFTID